MSSENVGLPVLNKYVIAYSCLQLNDEWVRDWKEVDATDEDQARTLFWAGGFAGKSKTAEVSIASVTLVQK